MAIANPVRIETAAFQGIVEIPPPRMAKHLQMRLPEEQLPTVRRVTESDLEELIPVSIELLRKTYPDISLNAVVAFVRGNLNSNQARIVRTGSAWGMAIIIRNFYEEIVSAEIKFVCKIKHSAPDAVAIYEDLKKWSKSVGAKRLYYGTTSSDTNIEAIAKRIGFSRKMIGYMVELGNG